VLMIGVAMSLWTINAIAIPAIRERGSSSA
jgi:hypothetical protein